MTMSQLIIRNAASVAIGVFVGGWLLIGSIGVVRMWMEPAATAEKIAP